MANSAILFFVGYRVDLPLPITDLTLPRLKPWDSEVLVRAQSISVLLKPSDEGVPSPLLRQTLKVLRLMDCYHPPQVVAGVST